MVSPISVVMGTSALAYFLYAWLIYVWVHPSFFVALMAIGAIVSSLIGIWVGHYIQRLLRSVSDSMNRVSHGDYNHMVTFSHLKPFHRFLHSYHAMLRAIQCQVDSLKKHAYEKEIILSNMIEGIITVNTDKKIRTINTRARALFSHSPGANLTGVSIYEALRNSAIQSLIHQSLSQQILVQGELTVLRPTVTYLHCNISPLYGSNDAFLGVVIVLRDISETKKMESIRRNFVSNVSHELKTPITIIKGFLETLIRGAIHDASNRDEFLTIIQTHTDRLDAIIDDLLTLSRLEESDEPIQMASIDMSNLVKNVITLCQSRGTRHHITTCANRPIMGEVNSVLIEQALVNLIDNAIKYSPETSTIHISLIRKDNRIEIGVRDEGIGIPQTDIPHLFERFYRVDKARSRQLGGTGLGLAIVKHIALVHNGSVHVWSQENQGSQFSIHIPANREILK